MRLDSTNYLDARTRILDWAEKSEPRVVCHANVQMAMESYDHADLRALINSADLVTPDGMPLVWALRLMGVADASQVAGPTLMPQLLEGAAAAGIAVGFFGASDKVLGSILAVCAERFPLLKVAYAHAPPFRPLSLQEDAAVVNGINESGVRLLFVGLGCPKQEMWMGTHKGRVKAAMVGVGAAFDFLAGTKPRAPAWMQGAGLEWLFRLVTEPRRLWRRYAYNNPRFLALLAGELLRSRAL